MATRESGAGRRITLEEFRRLPESSHFLHEVSGGLLVREPRPGRTHGTAVMLLGRQLTDFALEHGGIVTTETGFVLGEEPLILRGPDLAYVRSDPAPYGERDGYIAGAPDLAVEVVSPTNTAADIQEKVLQYLEAGCAEVWVVHPKTRSVVTHPATGEGRILWEADTLTSPVLPGLEIPVREVFRF